MGHAAFKDDDASRVRDASDIVSIVGDVVALTPKGREYKGLCPFHDDRNPSMFVVPNKQIFHCFVCGAGGDVFSFVKRFHGMEFPEALKFLAERAGIELTRRARPRTGDDTGVRKGDVIDANQFAEGLFRTLLAHDTHGKIAREIIEQRGISPEMVERFGLGYSADRWDGLCLAAAKKGIAEQHLMAAGLVKSRESGGVYDAFRNRLMFPIHQPQTGKPIAFGARKIKDEDEPKYLNSAETPAFNKSETLYGLFQAGKSIRERNEAVLVEGYTDVIACHQAGFTHAVATLGTAMTRGHARILKRLCDRVVLLFDGDEAGRRAAARAFEVLFAETLDVRVVTLDRVTDAKDPDELLKREGGADDFAKAIAGGVDLIDFHLRPICEQIAAAGPAGGARLLDDELRKLADLGARTAHPNIRDHLLRRLTDWSTLSPGVLRDRWAAIIENTMSPRRGRPVDAETDDGPQGLPGTPTQRALIGCLLAQPGLVHEFRTADRSLLIADSFDDRRLRLLADAITGTWDEGPGLSAVLSALNEHDDIKALAVAIESGVRAECGDDPARVAATLTHAITRLRDERSESETRTNAQADDPVERAQRLIELKRARWQRESAPPSAG